MVDAVINLETLTEVRGRLVDYEYISENKVDISSFLRGDLSLNLELLEVAIEFILEKYNSITITNINSYYAVRGIHGDDSQAKEEKNFILSFISSLAWKDIDGSLTKLPVSFEGENA